MALGLASEINSAGHVTWVKRHRHIERPPKAIAISLIVTLTLTGIGLAVYPVLGAVIGLAGTILSFWLPPTSREIREIERGGRS